MADGGAGGRRLHRTGASTRPGSATASPPTSARNHCWAARWRYRFHTPTRPAISAARSKPRAASCVRCRGWASCSGSRRATCSRPASVFTQAAVERFVAERQARAPVAGAAIPRTTPRATSASRPRDFRAQHAGRPQPHLLDHRPVPRRAVRAALLRHPRRQPRAASKPRWRRSCVPRWTMAW